MNLKRRKNGWVNIASEEMSDYISNVIKAFLTIFINKKIMQPLILYTRKFELHFNQDAVAQIDLSAIIEELSKDYVFLDAHPAIRIENNYQYVTFKLSKKQERKKIGF